MTASPEEPAGPAQARAIAYRYLGRREHGCRELALKLQRRGITAEIAAAVVDELEVEGLVSDTRFAEVFVRSKVARLFGPLKIRAQLRQKGVDDSCIQAALHEYDHQWRELALAWVGKKAAETLDRKDRARLYRGGKSRGFTHDQIMRALERFGAGP